MAPFAAWLAVAPVAMPQAQDKAQERRDSLRRPMGVVLGPGPAEEMMIERVLPLSPAHRAGLRPGDEIVRVSGVEARWNDWDAVRNALGREFVALELTRGRQRLYVPIIKRPRR